MIPKFARCLRKWLVILFIERTQCNRALFLPERVQMENQQFSTLLKDFLESKTILPLTLESWKIHSNQQNSTTNSLTLVMTFQPNISKIQACLRRSLQGKVLLSKGNTLNRLNSNVTPLRFFVQMNFRRYMTNRTALVGELLLYLSMQSFLKQIQTTIHS